MDYAGLHGPRELKGQCWETAWMDYPGGGSLRCEQITGHALEPPGI